MAAKKKVSALPAETEAQVPTETPATPEVAAEVGTGSKVAGVAGSALGIAKVFNAQKTLVNIYRESENEDYKDRATRLAAKMKGTVVFE